VVGEEIAKGEGCIDGTQNSNALNEELNKNGTRYLFTRSRKGTDQHDTSDLQWRRIYFVVISEQGDILFRDMQFFEVTSCRRNTITVLFHVYDHLMQSFEDRA